MTPRSSRATEARLAGGATRLDRFPLWASLILLALAAVLLVSPARVTWQSVYGARWAYILVVSGVISFGLTPVVIRTAHATGILDVPASRKVHSAPTPLLGGLAIYVAFTLAILANSILDRQVVAILLGATLLVVVGILDDIVELPAAIKLLAQLVAVAIVIGSGVVLSLFPRLWLGNLIDAVLTIVWLLGITNAMNFFDGMDGLATGLSIITASFLGLFAFLTSQPFLGWFAAAVVGSCLGFLPFNFRPRGSAAIFLGDSGSTFLGFVLAALAVKGEWAESSLVDIAAPLLIFWVFIYDMAHITVARIVTGKVRSFRDWIAYVGRDHLHHRLDALLGSKRKAVVLVFAFSICMGLAAIALVHARGFEAALLILQAVLIAAIFSVLEYAGTR
jgi:UDP-GlcNAc:undecaprenyl-phosphate/decaprenyl-phosphate GlcNAc-1-phosphate transferase